jgi:hypothetical protein
MECLFLQVMWDQTLLDEMKCHLMVHWANNGYELQSKIVILEVVIVELQILRCGHPSWLESSYCRAWLEALLRLCRTLRATPMESQLGVWGQTFTAREFILLSNNPAVWPWEHCWGRSNPQLSADFCQSPPSRNSSPFLYNTPRHHLTHQGITPHGTKKDQSSGVGLLGRC